MADVGLDSHLQGPPCRGPVGGDGAFSRPRGRLRAVPQRLARRSHQNPRVGSCRLDPSHQQFESQLTALKKEVPILVGVRHILDLEPRPKYLELEEVAAGVRALHRHDMTFDLLLRPPLLEGATVPAECPKRGWWWITWPNPTSRTVSWTRGARTSPPSHAIPISSMVTEADCEKWKPEDLRPYVEHMIAVFGCDRLMYGSDWPVCHLARADYNTVFSTLRGLLGHLPEPQLEKIFCSNARNFYKV
ncbi:putative L-rhamnono-gamma-lactonase-like [Penaeus vannamei]|uniref:Putative L-rhamnono-gamma-lactonase-like n=1 Tax=Penaeus vannamei TaxID=6689 RepID=A0A423SXG2_PENVA|nr:putative L-rhamnono-gamma-lactonase-like [Penaeus vannamei]